LDPIGEERMQRKVTVAQAEDAIKYKIAEVKII
jgi:hypothetical protein